MSEYSNYLAHHGVKGMRWGVRNEETKRRLLNRAGGRREKAESGTWKSGEAKYLTNEELDRRNTRLQKENQYRTNVENRHPVSKEIKSAAKKIFLYSAIGAVSGIMAANYRAGANNFISGFLSYKLPT